MPNFKQGDIITVNLNPSKGTETKKTRPCLVVSNNNYNQLLNTIIIAPISRSKKYNNERFKVSPFFIPLPKVNQTKGTILLQHIRSIDPNSRVIGKRIETLDPNLIKEINSTLQHFF